MSAYSFIWAAAVISDGFVVASRGLNFSIEWMSPVSATVTVTLLSCSSTLAILTVPLNLPVVLFGETAHRA